MSGIILASREMNTLERIRTKVVASPIPIPLIAEVVVPIVGHIPSTRIKVGLSFMMPLVIIFSLLIFRNYLDELTTF